MYSIQVGDRLFRLSGASISFDSPSYFTSFFGRKENENKVLTVDRSAAVFDKICSHLQGYCIRADNEYELMHLYADATYFNLQKLLKQLTEEFYHCNVGGLSFRFPQELLAGEGNSPNYFTVAYQTTFQSAYFRGELKDMIRPPPQSPIVVKRSGKLFNDLLNALSTGRVCVESEEHRRQLLAECRYYRFLALEQKLIPHKIQMNPFFHREEIVVALADVKRDGLSISSDSPVLYKRPYVDAKARVLVLQIESEEAIDGAGGRQRPGEAADVRVSGRVLVHAERPRNEEQLVHGLLCRRQREHEAAQRRGHRRQAAAVAMGHPLQRRGPALVPRRAGRRRAGRGPLQPPPRLPVISARSACAAGSPRTTQTDRPSRPTPRRCTRTPPAAPQPPSCPARTRAGSFRCRAR
ncbi:hypothetical protein KL951_000489 [Ogataea haglerorum]|nr:hypothetical protein KL951_000489 [Ogataea haglerorum]